MNFSIVAILGAYASPVHLVVVCFGSPTASTAVAPISIGSDFADAFVALAPPECVAKGGQEVTATRVG